MHSIKKLHLLISILILLFLLCAAGCTPEPAPTNTPIPTHTSTYTPTPSPTATATQTPSPTPTSSPQPSPTPTIVKLHRMHPDGLPDLVFGPPGNSQIDVNRPEMSGIPVTLDTINFRIHYTLEGEDRVPEKDNDNNGHPDYVEQTARVMEYIWDTSINYFGWNPPPVDDGKGGDDRYDVYLIDVINREGAFGYAHGGHGYTFIGDNPLTEIVEHTSHNSFFVLDNDYARYFDTEYEYNEEFLDNLYSTAGHEFMHALQFGYNGEEEMKWLWEATADWYEDELFNKFNGSVGALDAVFKSPDTCQLAEGGDERVEDIHHWYGMWIFIRYLSEQYSHETVRAIWENLIDFDGYQALEITFIDLETTLDDFFVDFALALLARDFDETREYPILRLEGKAKPDRLFEPVNGIGQMGADFVEIDADEMVTIYFKQENMKAFAVGMKNNLLHVFPVVDGETSIDAGNYIHTYLVIVNLDKAETEEDCFFADYVIDIISGGDQREPAWTVPAKNFKAPVVEGLADGTNDFFGP